MTTKHTPTPYTIHAFEQDIQGWIDKTCMLDGELTHIIHFPHPLTGTVLVTTRKAG